MLAFRPFIKMMHQYDSLKVDGGTSEASTFSKSEVFDSVLTKPQSDEKVIRQFSMAEPGTMFSLWEEKSPLFCKHWHSNFEKVQAEA